MVMMNVMIKLIPLTRVMESDEGFKMNAGRRPAQTRARESRRLSSTNPSTPRGAVGRRAPTLALADRAAERDRLLHIFAAALGTAQFALPLGRQDQLFKAVSAIGARVLENRHRTLPLGKLLRDIAGDAIRIHVARCYDLVIDQDQWVRQVTIRRRLQCGLELLLNLGQRGIKVLYRGLIPIDAREKALNEACGLLRRPTWPSTPCTDFVPAMPQYNDLNLLANCLLHHPLLIR